MPAPDADDPLLGCWRLVRADAGLDFAPGLRMEFIAGGVLRYSFKVGGVRQMVPLRYRVEGATLRTEVEGTTHEATAAFEFGPGNVLVFDFGTARAWLVREVVMSAKGTG